MKTLNLILTIALSLILIISPASAVILNSVLVDTIAPGQEGQIRIEIENILDDDVEDVTLRLNFQDLKIIPIGSSEQSTDEIDEDDEENYVFRVKAASDITPGDYEIPYTLEYIIDNEQKTRSGTIGIRVSANPELSFTVNSNSAVLNQESQINLKVINKGFFDARFVSVRIIPDGFTLLSDSEVYIGTVDSDDFETANFDVFFRSKNPKFTAIVEFKDFDNILQIKTIDLPLKVFSREEALELGIISKSNATAIVTIVITLILIWILWRQIKKGRRLKRSKNERR